MTSPRHIAREIATWRPVEREPAALVLGGLLLGAPLLIGQASGHLLEGTLAGLGVLLVSSSGWAGPVRERALDLAGTAASGAVAFGLGLVAARHGAAVPVTVLIAALAGVTGGVNRLTIKLSILGLVFAVIGWSDAAVPLPTTSAMGWFVIGAVGAAALTFARGILELGPLARDAGPSAVTAAGWRADVYAWHAGIRTIAGWRFVADLTICTALAGLVTHLWPAPHATWTVLTVSLVVQRDRRAGEVRIFERGVGTAVGVVVAAALLSEGVPTWLIILGVVLIGAVRPHVKRANYTLYAALMTPLVVLLTSIGRTRLPGLLSARLEYTAVGCLIALIVGAAFDITWPRRPSES